jgi:hypothetical protein
VLSDDQVDAFRRDGFVKLERAVPRAVAAECAELLWAQVEAEPDDPDTWREPVEWMGGPAFWAAADVSVLTAAFDQLVGAGPWVPQEGMGSFPIRFPHAVEPDDAGWHVEGSCASEHGPGWWTRQPGIAPGVPVRLDRAEEDCSVVEATIRDALRG